MGVARCSQVDGLWVALGWLWESVSWGVPECWPPPWRASKLQILRCPLRRVSFELTLLLVRLAVVKDY
jgi:hypothetical protein